MESEAPPFWERLSLAQMDHEQWESLCDGCALCCLHKLQDEDSGEVYLTAVACRLLDLETCRCQDYAHRSQRVTRCMMLRHEDTQVFDWLPESCAYRRLHEGHGLPWWHPLVAREAGLVHELELSARGRCVPESTVDLSDPESWPFLDEWDEEDEDE